VKLDVVLKIALRALFRNQLRTLLTMLGIVIGVGAVLVMVSIGGGARQQVEERIASLGQNVVVIFPGSQTSTGVRSGSGTSQSLTLDDVDAIRQECPSVQNVSPVARRNFQVVAGNQNWFTYVEGVGTEYIDIRTWPLARGEPFTDANMKSAAKVCVLGATVAEKLFGSEDPIGETVRIQNVPLQVVGILTRKGQSVKGQDQDDVVLVPVTTHIQRLYRRGRMTSVIASARTAEDIDDAQEEITALLRQRHKIGNPEDDDFTVRNQEEIAEAATATSRVLTALLASVAGVSLVVGGIGIMNIMLVSVTERTREIGLRLAVGAKARDILMQFLVEAVVLSSLGGLIGIAIGLAASQVLASWRGWSVLLSVPAVVLAVLFAGAVGVFFGFYPAYKASRLEPIDALRYE